MITKRVLKSEFLRRAIELANENVRMGKGGPFGAVIVKDGKIVGEGANSVTRLNDPSAHAEVMAIRDACKNLNDFSLVGCDLYTSCLPCPLCLSTAYWARLNQIYYGSNAHDAAEAGFDDAFLYDEFLKPADQRLLKTTLLLKKPAAEPFRLWNNSLKKIRY